MSKEAKIKVWFDEASYHQEMTNTIETVEVYKAAVKELESIIEKPIDNPIEFRYDPLLYSIAQIKLKYPGAFNLNLPLDKTLQMLSIDVKKLEQYDAVLKTTPHKIDVCSKTGNCTPTDAREPFTYYAQTPEQHERLKFSNDLIAILEKCHEYAPYRGKHNLVTSVIQFAYLDPQLGIIPNHNFVLNGIQ